MLDRRNLLATLICAPAIVRASSLMAVHTIKSAPFLRLVTKQGYAPVTISEDLFTGMADAMAAVPDFTNARFEVSRHVRYLMDIQTIRSKTVFVIAPTQRSLALPDTFRGIPIQVFD